HPGPGFYVVILGHDPEAHAVPWLNLALVGDFQTQCSHVEVALFFVGIKVEVFKERARRLGAQLLLPFGRAELLIRAPQSAHKAVHRYSLRRPGRSLGDGSRKWSQARKVRDREYVGANTSRQACKGARGRTERHRALQIE